MFDCKSYTMCLKSGWDFKNVEAETMFGIQIVTCTI